MEKDVYMGTEDVWVSSISFSRFAVTLKLLRRILGL